MRVQDFEQAIEALNCNIEIDEMKIRHGQVRQVNGHTSGLKVVWDELGRAFSMPFDQDAEEFIDVDSGSIVNGRRLERDSNFDLKFQ